MLRIEGELQKKLYSKLEGLEIEDKDEMFSWLFNSLSDDVTQYLIDKIDKELDDMEKDLEQKSKDNEAAQEAEEEPAVS